MPAPSKLHRNDKLWGAMGEALVAAYALISANGKLVSYRPLTDVDGKDIVIDLAESFKDNYLQVKCALGLDRFNRIRGTVRLHGEHIPTDPKLLYVFCLLDREKMELSRIWVVPAVVFYRGAYQTKLAKGMVQFNFDCQSKGDKRWDEFEVSRHELGLRLLKYIAPSNRLRLDKPREKLEGRWVRVAA